ncbi:molybdopterin-guanine dinucleotide biosynthesis protein B [Achromobacter sp. RTa]|uniref:molybdopterin-guanine dinucleotide biosynthesis protein B n=1 Tax=Achromobacter sp. RTa TaxID=1532557 RepID=UPI00050FF3FE|nr:molybdopterin-guanine dinucleotide biosynthesis protein B [Achromobacter sp. RTa]KGD90121.1 molybdopterin-guanine dinucleotide biosynthesis protein B [Achromobacter sp. RTa]
MTRVIGFAGWSGAGKTQLLTRLIPVLKSRGLSVSTLKHAHHAFDIDHPGKDSYLHREAGASEVLVASSARWAIMHELRGEPEPGLGELLGRMSVVDLVLIEGFKRNPHIKIEVHREANAKPWLYPDDASIGAIVSDVPPPSGGGLPWVGLDDYEAVADLVQAHAWPLEQVLASMP